MKVYWRKTMGTKLKDMASVEMILNDISFSIISTDAISFNYGN